MSKQRAPGRNATPQAALDALLAEPASDSARDPIRRALWLDGLDRRLHPLLPPALAPHARLANFERGRLVFVVDAPVWRAKLRLAAPELLDAARSLGIEASELVVRAVPGPSAPATPPSASGKARPIPASALEALQAALASLRSPDPSDPGDAA